ncbi:MAG: bi-domain-containing oxidoreductase [Planctomycetaceae bacterium]|nr:bi-domain-containing oxidoreductase [Planctomycetaceae bacterium]
MRQILQSVKDGETLLCDVPCPQVGRGQLLIRTHTTLISAGTERMLVEFGKAGWLDKARQQPDKVRQVLDKVKTDGLLPTLEAVKNKLDQPVPLGYSNVGTVLEVGTGVQAFEPGDRVLSNGAHAEVVCIPQNLCARIPDGVSDEAASFGVVAAIGLQGIRLAQPTLGEAFVVSGLGLIGLLTVQLLRAHGCRVLGLDFNPQRLAQAAEFGADVFNLADGDPVPAAIAFSRGRGVDGVLITAATQSDEPVRQAAHMCRKRGRLVLVGVAGLQLSRADFYEKELSFQVSCSYGPGRYDPTYEQQGHDYPLGFVRWTEQRNFEAVLDMMQAGRLDPQPLITHRFDLSRAADAYSLIASDQPSLGVLLGYPQPKHGSDGELQRTTVQGSRLVSASKASAPRVAFIGAGNFASQVLIPAFKNHGAQLAVVASRSGLSAAVAGRKFGFGEVTSDINAPFADPGIDVIVIATRHDSHADLVCRALDAGKHVFVEKPLALNSGQLDDVVTAASGASHLLMVGFNRRFSPHVQRMRTLLAGAKEAKAFVMTVNAGMIPADHWVHDPHVGGGRLIGEGCHFVDLLRFLCGHPITSVQAAIFSRAACDATRGDRATFTLSFADGSIGTVHYLANGHRAVPKERLEVFCGGRVLQLDNFRKLRGVGWSGLKSMNLWKQDKGHAAGVAAFLRAVREGGPPPIPFDELVEVSRATIDVVRAAETNETVHYDTTGVNRTPQTSPDPLNANGFLQNSPEPTLAE